MKISFSRFSIKGEDQPMLNFLSSSLKMFFFAIEDSSFPLPVVDNVFADRLAILVHQSHLRSSYPVPMVDEESFV